MILPPDFVHLAIVQDNHVQTLHFEPISKEVLLKEMQNKEEKKNTWATFNDVNPSQINLQSQTVSKFSRFSITEDHIINKLTWLLGNFTAPT